jgi:hypothetical protein
VATLASRLSTHGSGHAQTGRLCAKESVTLLPSRYELDATDYRGLRATFEAAFASPDMRSCNSAGFE